MFVRKNRDAAARAGFGGSVLAAGNKLFDAIISQPSGVIYSVSEYADSWRAVRLPDHKINLCIEEMLAELETLDSKLPQQDADYPFVLSAGERRSDTSNTSIRDAGWHRRGTFGTLRMHPADAEKIGCKEGDWVRMTTRRGQRRAPRRTGRRPAARPRGTAQWPRTRLHGSGWHARAQGRVAQRAHRHGKPRPVRRHAVAQARARPDRAPGRHAGGRRMTHVVTERRSSTNADLRGRCGRLDLLIDAVRRPVWVVLPRFTVCSRECGM